MNSFKNAKKKEMPFEKISKEVRSIDLREIEVVDLSSGSDEDVIVVKEVGNKSETILVQEDDSFSVSSEHEFRDNDFNDINLNIKSYDSDGNVSDVNTGIMVKWKKVVSPKGWTDQMKKYYNKPCNEQRYFDWKNILENMRRDNSGQWYISHRDVYPSPYRLKRCLICRQTDHLANKCPRKNVNCSMCGVPGHSYYRCPRSMCLNCGIHKNSYVDYCSNCDYWRKVKCTSCKRYGHETKNCTDQWRRFHCTVDNKQINSSGSTLNKNIQCCNCAKPGHLYEDCKEQYFSGYMPNSSMVGDYRDINNKFDFKSNNTDAHRVRRAKTGKRSRFNGVLDSDDDDNKIVGRKYMKLDKNRKRSDRQRSFMNLLGMPSDFPNLRSSRLPKIKKAKKKKKKKSKSSLEQD